MDKLSFFQRLCQDTFANCLTFLKKEQRDKNYEPVGSDTRSHEHDEEGEGFNDWGNETSIYKSSKEDKPMDVPLANIKKPVLIGNIDEDQIRKKEDVMN